MFCVDLYDTIIWSIYEVFIRDIIWGDVLYCVDIWELVIRISHYSHLFLVPAQLDQIEVKFAPKKILMQWNFPTSEKNTKNYTYYVCFNYGSNRKLFRCIAADSGSKGEIKCHCSSNTTLHSVRNDLYAPIPVPFDLDGAIKYVINIRNRAPKWSISGCLRLFVNCSVRP